MKKISVVLSLFVLALIAYLFWPSDESRIKKLFKEGAKAVESGDIDGIMAKVSYNYRDDYGMSYITLKEQLKRQFATLSDIDVEYEDLKIDVTGDAATAELKLRVVATIGKETGYILGDIKTPLVLKVTLAKEHTKWLITGSIPSQGTEGAYRQL